MKKITFVLLGFLAFSKISKAQETTFKGFANIDYQANKQNNSFVLGQYDQYITSKLTDRISFLGEAVFEHDGHEFGLDVERIILKYEFNDYFYIRTGKFHSPIGYWNNAYHHGTVIQPTISRPLAVRFEDNGGILQCHQTGLWLAGDNIGSLRLGYDFVISNGIGGTPISDNNSSKAVTGTLRMNPIDGLNIGVTGYFDNIANDVDRLNDPLLGTLNSGYVNNAITKTGADLKHQNLSGFLAYKGDKLHFITEFYNIQNKNTVVGTKTTNAGFAYLGYKAYKEFTPYVRYDFLNTQSGDVYYSNQNTTMYTIGLRYEFDYTSNLKFEYSNLVAKNLADKTLNQRVDNFRIQYSVAF